LRERIDAQESAARERQQPTGAAAWHRFELRQQLDTYLDSYRDLSERREAAPRASGGPIA
jgi:hypothetical protein